MKPTTAMSILKGYCTDADLPRTVKLAVAAHAAAVALRHNPGAAAEVADLLSMISQRACIHLGLGPEVLHVAPFAIRQKLDDGRQLGPGDRSHLLNLESSLCVQEIVEKKAIHDAVQQSRAA